MPTCTVSKCCFCLTLYGASWVIAVGSLLMGIITGLVLVVKAVLEEQRRLMLTALAGLATTLFVASAYLIRGLHKKVPGHLKCWCVVAMCTLVFIVLTGMTLAVYYYSFQHDHTSGTNCVIATVVAFFCMYFVIVVYSYGITLRKTILTQPRQWDKEHLHVDPH